MTLRLKRIVKPSGRIYWYARQPHGGLARMPDLPHDDPAFLAAYAAAMAAPPPAVPTRHGPGSIGAAIDAWIACDAFAALAEKTQAMRRAHLGHIARDWGDARIADLAARHIEADIGALAAHPGNTRLKAWRGLTRWAIERRLIRRDVAQDVRRPRLPQSDGHPPWSDAEVARFRAHWPYGTAQRLAFELLAWTAARIGDAVKLGPGMVDADGWLCYRQEKTEGDVTVPFRRSLPAFAAGWAGELAHLHAAIAAAETARGRHLTWLVTAAGASRSPKAAASWFSKAAQAAGVERTAHGLRKRRAERIAEAGGTTAQIQAWLGHESPVESHRYAKRAERKRVLTGTD